MKYDSIQPKHFFSSSTNQFHSFHSSLAGVHLRFKRNHSGSLIISFGKGCIYIYIWYTTSNLFENYLGMVLTENTPDLETPSAPVIASILSACFGLLFWDLHFQPPSRHAASLGNLASKWGPDLAWGQRSWTVWRVIMRDCGCMHQMIQMWHCAAFTSSLER